MTIVGLGYSSADCLTSVDGGHTFTRYGLHGNSTWYRVGWNGSYFLALTNGSTGVAISTDGITWTYHSGVLPSGTWSVLAWNGSIWCAVDIYTARAITSPDGLTWTVRTLPSNNSWSDISWNGSVFCVSSNSVTQTLTSPDGITWTAHSALATMNRIIFDGTNYVGINGTSTCYTSTDGINWTARTMPDVGAPHVAFTTSRIVILSNNGYTLISVNHGVSWSKYATIPTHVFGDIAVDSTGFAALENTALVGFYSTDGHTWTQIATPTSGSWVMVGDILIIPNPTSITGDIAQTLPLATQSASGDVTYPIPQGDINQTLPMLTQSMVGKEVFQGPINQTLPKLTQSGVMFDNPAGPINQTLYPLGKQTASVEITGPFFFAWCNEADAFSSAMHRFDEDIFSFQFEQQEGEFATLTIEIKNPKVGLLSVGRQLWCWFAVAVGGTVYELFHGRLVGIPTSIFNEVVTLQFIAQSSTFSTDKIALANSLKVFPYYDELFISSNSIDDPDTVLEGYSKVWYIDPKTLAVETSDIINGEDGLQEFTADEVPYDSVQISISGPPLQTVHMDATISWTQSAQGTVDLISPYKYGFFRNGQYRSYSYDKIQSGWPKDGAQLGSGWVAIGSKCNLVNDLTVKTENYSYKGVKINDGSEQWVPSYNSSTDYIEGGIPEGSKSWAITVDRKSALEVGWSGHPGSVSYSSTTETFVVPYATLSVALSAKYACARNCSERIQFDLIADVQELVVNSDDAKTIALQSNNASDLLSDGVTLPIGDVRRRSYITTVRGNSSLEYLLAIARANLLMGSRVVDVAYEVPFSRMVSLTLRNNGKLDDPRLPTGSAIGKVKKLEIVLNGDDGQVTCTVTMGCAVGKDGVPTTSAGTGCYAAAGYMQSGYQEMVSQQVALASSDVSYVKPQFAPNDDGIEFINGLQAADVFETFWASHNGNPNLDGLGFPLTGLGQSIADSLKKGIESLPVESLTFTLKPLGGTFQTDYNIAVDKLYIPKMIDMGG